jgi:hypothetical protein
MESPVVRALAVRSMLPGRSGKSGQTVSKGINVGGDFIGNGSPIVKKLELLVQPEFRNRTLLLDHFAKHSKGILNKRNNAGVLKDVKVNPRGIDLPEYTTLNAYETAAKQMWSRNASINLLEKTLSNGDRIRWDRVNQTFGVLSKDGYIRTFFRPTNGYQTFVDAIR